jgi:hypothetical protein
MNVKTLTVMFIFTMSLSLPAIAQPINIPKIEEESIMTRQADSLKGLFLHQGFEIIRETTIKMKSQYEKPIILPLQEGTWYRVIFIGDNTSKLFEIRMYDWNEKRVVYQKQRSREINGNIINYDYIPRFSEYHMIKPVQVNKKKKEVSGRMLLFKKLIKV